MIRRTHTTDARRAARRDSRPGTTLVELMVAAAMLILGMWLLVWLYQQGMSSFLGAKSAADLTTQQRTVATVLTRDLGAPFFLDEDGKPNRGRRLSDQRTDQVGSGWVPPRGGFFSAKSTSYLADASNTYEATDGDGFVSSRSVTHWLQFTILLPGGPNYQLVGAEVPVGTGNQMFGTAAEVTYALVPNGLTTAGGVTLYDLIRRQRLTALTGDDTPVYQAAFSPYLGTDNVSEVTTFTGNTPGSTMLNMLNLTQPGNRLPQAQWPLTPSSSRYGEERLVTNVLSFEVKFTGPTANVGLGAWPGDQYSNAWPRPTVGNVVGANQGQANLDFPYDFLPFNGQFDTYSSQVANWQTQVASASAPNNPIKPIRITGVMIRLRTYDLKNQTTRQTSIISAL